MKVNGSHAPKDYQIDTHNHGLDTNVYGLIEDAISRMFNMVHTINSSHHHLILSDRRQRKQLDEISLDVESLKDEMDDYFAKLRDLDTQAAALKDDIQRKSTRQGEDQEEVGENAERHERGDECLKCLWYGLTEPSHVVRRTTQPRTLVTRDVTMPDATRTYVTPSTRSRSLTADPLLKVTNSPSGSDDNHDEKDVDKGSDVTIEEGADSKPNHLVAEPDEELNPTTLLRDKTSEYLLRF